MNESPRHHEAHDTDQSEIEQRLKASAPADLPAGAGDRIEHAMRRAARDELDWAQPSWWRVPVPRWQAVAASLLVAAGASFATAWLMTPAPADGVASHEGQHEDLPAEVVVIHRAGAWPASGGMPVTDIRAWQPVVVN